jgi:hypothetical protein
MFLSMCIKDIGIKGVIEFNLSAMAWIQFLSNVVPLCALTRANSGKWIQPAYGVAEIDGENVRYTAFDLIGKTMPSGAAKSQAHHAPRRDLSINVA